jgi:hypothetical protein
MARTVTSDRAGADRPAICGNRSEASTIVEVTPAGVGGSGPVADTGKRPSTAPPWHLTGCGKGVKQGWISARHPNPSLPRKRESRYFNGF